MIRQSHALAFIVLSACGLAAAGCTKHEPSPEARCSAPTTYDQIYDMLASQIAQARVNGASNEIVTSASSVRALKSVLSLELPTLQDVNQTTHKIGCAAMLRIAANSQVQQGLDTEGLDINEVAADHIQVRIRYSLQPTADTGEPVLELQQASAVAIVAVQASIAAVQRMRVAEGSLPPNAVTVEMGAGATNGTGQEQSTEPTPLTPSSRDVDSNEIDDTPTPPAAEDSSATAETAREFAAEYFRQAGGSGDDALAWLSQHYADTVRFFGKDTQRDVILQQKAAYLRRWPERSYTIEPASVTVECQPGGPMCHVAGIIEWSASSEDRNANASGKSAFDLVVSTSRSTPLIVGENSRVIGRSN